MNLISVFTPTFNRGHLLKRLYDSLLVQDFKNFEWIIVDDGSTDDTKDVVDCFIKEEKINIRYFYQQNGGKHRAINRGVVEARGNLFLIVDSDDYLTDNCLEVVDKYVKKISDDKTVGVCGLKADKFNQIVGTTFDGDIIELLNFDRKKNNITGDRAEVYYTDILKKYPFPEYDDEKFLTEAVVWDKIAIDGYKLLYFNEIIYVCEYLSDGLTSNVVDNYRKSPKGFLNYISQLLFINKKNLFQRIRLVSLYYEVMFPIYSIGEMCDQLNISRLFMYFSILIRKLFKK